jgi:uncharacterized coiled-coil protein SlyX
VNAYAAKLTGQERQLEAKNAALSEARGRLRQFQAQLDKLMNSLTIE